jgi:hypothetical protein
MTKWLEILKLEHSDIHLALFATFAVFWILKNYGVIPPLDAYRWVDPVILLFLLLFGFLLVVKVLNSLTSRR